MTESVNELQCPVCRARQPWRDTCRRCQADLSLLTRALRFERRTRARLLDARRRNQTEDVQRLARLLLALRPDPAQRQWLRAAELVPSDDQVG